MLLEFWTASFFRASDLMGKDMRAISRENTQKIKRMKVKGM